MSELKVNMSINDHTSPHVNANIVHIRTYINKYIHVSTCAAVKIYICMRVCASAKSSYNNMLISAMRQ